MTKEKIIHIILLILSIIFLSIGYEWFEKVGCIALADVLTFIFPLCITIYTLYVLFIKPFVKE